MWQKRSSCGVGDTCTPETNILGKWNTCYLYSHSLHSIQKIYPNTLQQEALENSKPICPNTRIWRKQAKAPCAKDKNAHLIDSEGINREVPVVRDMRKYQGQTYKIPILKDNKMCKWGHCLRAGELLVSPSRHSYKCYKCERDYN